jgi:hypothetical protein
MLVDLKNLFKKFLRSTEGVCAGVVPVGLDIFVFPSEVFFLYCSSLFFFFFFFIYYFSLDITLY